MLLRTFSVHAKVVARDAKEMLNMQDTRTGFVSCKSILKHQKLLLQDVTLGAWVLKYLLIGKDQ